MSCPKVALVGRPNVGKSALFNSIIGKRIAIVDESEGVTRDRNYAYGEIFGMPFELIDTAGIDFDKKRDFHEELLEQTRLAIEEADSIIMVVDSRLGITRLDEAVAEMLLKSQKRVVLAVNKIDNLEQEYLKDCFYSLGIEEVLAVSAIQGYQLAELMQAALQDVKIEERALEEKRLRLSIIGRPNVGKSTFLNAILKEKRSVVSSIAGTTRDSVEAVFGDYLLVDTAGIRRKAKESNAVEKFARLRTDEAIVKSDICIFMFDAVEGLSQQDRKIINLLEKEGKGCLIICNKWDLVKGVRMEHYERALKEKVGCYPILFVSSKEGRNLDKVWKIVKSIEENLKRKITTGELNRFLERTMQLYHPPMIQGKRLRIFYATQTAVIPPRFKMFVNYPELMLISYEKYLVNRFREAYGFEGVPLKFELVKRSSPRER